MPDVPLSLFGQPVDDVDTGSRHKEPDDGIGLCLSGGGYRAMLFHLGVVWRLNDIGYLPRLDRISSVSGGSITAGVLGMNWMDLAFDANGRSDKFDELVVRPVRRIAGKTIDRKAIFGGMFGPGTISAKVAKAYDRYLFDGKTLQDLPDDPPRFVFNATNVQSGSLWRFMKPYMRDWRVGEVKNPTVPLALAVAASSAFPPVLSPANLNLDGSTFTPGSGSELQREPFTTDVVLTDGGVYDNLGIEPVWKRYKTILVSDGGGQMAPDPDPKRDWAGHAKRILNIIDNQVRSLRKRQIMGSFDAGVRSGAYWGMRTAIDEFDAPSALPCPHERTMALAKTPTRLKQIEPVHQERLINWGYAICDAAMRGRVDASLPRPDAFPYPDAAV
jgi:NTE family protein